MLRVVILASYPMIKIQPDPLKKKVIKEAEKSFIRF